MAGSAGRLFGCCAEFFSELAYELGARADGRLRLLGRNRWLLRRGTLSLLDHVRVCCGGRDAECEAKHSE